MISTTMRAAPDDRGLSGVDLALIVFFLLGLYLGVSLQITSKVPLTSAPSGVAGVILLWRRRDAIQPKHLAGLLGVVALYLASILIASDMDFLGKRFTGLLQLTYALVISYALFLTLVLGERRQIAWILLGFCIVIIIGCILESNTGLRAISDKVRERIYEDSNIYDADLRDQTLYGRVRPKLFTAEPSYVTFSYTYFGAAWLVVSTWRWKLPIYLVLVGLAFMVLPGPTLVLMLLLMILYLLFLAGGSRRSSTRVMGMVVLSLILLAITIVVGQLLFRERLNELARGDDASFFFRFTGPMLVAFDVIHRYPWAGAGLTGEPFIADEVMNVYINSSSFHTGWRFSKISEVLTNYFWLHWIYLGLVGGVIMLVAISMWLKLLGVPSVLYCWGVWLCLGQAAGAYVSPKTWAVLLIAAAASILGARVEQRRPAIRRSRGPLRQYRPELAT